MKTDLFLKILTIVTTNKIASKQVKMEHVKSSVLEYSMLFDKYSSVSLIIIAITDY